MRSLELIPSTFIKTHIKSNLIYKICDKYQESAYLAL